MGIHPVFSSNLIHTNSKTIKAGTKIIRIEIEQSDIPIPINITVYLKNMGFLLLA